MQKRYIVLCSVILLLLSFTTQIYSSPTVYVGSSTAQACNYWFLQEDYRPSDDMWFANLSNVSDNEVIECTP